MDWIEAVEIEIARSKHERWRALTAESHPDHAIHRARVVAIATGNTPATYPSLTRQAGNALAAAGRVTRAFVRNEPVKVPAPIYYHRLEICQACPHNGEAPHGMRCKKCGCGGMKLELATEACPDNPSRWGRWEKPLITDNEVPVPSEGTGN